MNLLNNAVKYNRRGGRVWLRCREIADRPDRSWFEFVCEDTGIGMSEAYQQHIFEPFSQESDGVKSKYDGTGLGLPITKRMIELMDGTIDFGVRRTSVPDLRSDFRWRLTLYPVIAIERSTQMRQRIWQGLEHYLLKIMK